MDNTVRPISSRPTTVRVGREGRGLTVVVILAIVLIALATVKPWGAGGRSATVGQRGPSATIPAGTAGPIVAAAAAPVQLDPAVAICGRPLDWRVLTVGRWLDVTSRASIALTPVAAAAPTDPRIPFVTADGVWIDALGWCAPATDDVAPGAPIVTAWRVGSPGSVPLTLRAASASKPSRDGAVYGPPTNGSGVHWPDGKYVFRVDASTDTRGARWFGIQVRTQPVR